MKRIAIIGAGMRATKFIEEALATDYRDTRPLVAVCDQSLSMLEAKRGEFDALGLAPRFYAAAAFEEMIRQEKPHEVLVLTPDHTHADYVCRAMELGCDVIVEKPLTTTYEHCRQILDAEARTGRRCTVTHNYRYAPRYMHLKHLLRSGVIGKPLQINWATGVGLWHGTKYFHRWHAERRCSSTLLVHKCCHLFDLVNFWIGDTPRRAYAHGALNLFGQQQAKRMGLEEHGERCGECSLTDRCPYYWNTTTAPSANERPEAVAARGEDTGYYRDKCVFRSEIDTFDTFSAMYEYDSGTQFTLSWTAGLTKGSGLLFRGTLGSLEYDWSEPDSFVVRKHDGTVETITPWKGAGGHGGADPKIYADLFSDAQTEDEYGLRADLRDGVWAVLMGLGALESIDTGKAVDLSQRVQVGRPDFVAMPDPFDPIDPEPIRKVLQQEEAAKRERLRRHKETLADSFAPEG